MTIKFSFTGSPGTTLAQTDVFMLGLFTARLPKIMAAQLILAGAWL